MSEFMKSLLSLSVSGTLLLLLLLGLKQQQQICQTCCRGNYECLQ